MKWDSIVWDLISPLLKWSLYLPLFCGGDSRHGTSGSETKNLAAYVSASKNGQLSADFLCSHIHWGGVVCQMGPPWGQGWHEFFYQTISKPFHSSKLLLPQQLKLPYQPWETAWVEYVQSLEVLVLLLKELQRSDFRQKGVVCWSRQGGACQKGIVSWKVIYIFLI